MDNEYMNHNLEINNVNTKFDKEIDRIRDHAFKFVVIPFCDKYNVEFWSGMGGYGFIDRRKRDLIDLLNYREKRYQKTQILKELLIIEGILELKAHYNDRYPIGCYMGDYPRIKK